MENWAVIFLVVTLPFCLYATWTDLKFLKIPNIIPVSMVLVFIVVGPFVLPFTEYKLSLLYGLIALLLSLVVFAARLIPAGDLKYATAIIPYVDTGELLNFTVFLSLCSLLAVLTHTVFGRLGLGPSDWASWQESGWKRRFPFGFALSGALITYLASHIIRAV